MDVLTNVVQYVLNLGASVFVPIIMLIIGICARMKFKDAISAAIIFGVAFAGMNLVVGFMLDSISPAAQAFAKNTGIALTAVDGGWTTGASITWAWPLAFLIFPITIGVNIVMLALKWTKTLNVDMWNVWGKAFTAIMVSYISGNVYLGFVVVVIQIIIELKIGDIWGKEIEELTGIPGVTVPHHMTIIASLLYPINQLMDKIPMFNKKMDADALKEKLGVFAENHVMGAIVGFLLGLVAGYGVSKSLILAVQAATALTLFPMVSKLFMQALSPISEAISDFMRKHFNNREILIGLDWPILAGRNELWVTAILLIPVELLFAVILPGNKVLPFGGIINLSIVVAVVLLARGNLLRMVVYGVITTPVFLYLATFFAPYMTRLAQETHAVKVPAGSMLTWSTMENGEFKFAFSEAMAGKWWGILLAVVWIALFVYFYFGRKKENAKRYHDEAKAEGFES
ncbi:PTS galactitol transporter subunit IIC [Sporolactobacillus sp. STSJ-5]|uniref:PTS galactitol transporter subunit IIC n=1 Tax=Sporolactobacillus sp. STSJ-5 TaxID=2965076 RepID=UPI00210686E1|nr:PTS transporter subunit IIC [Sporolactobacillus sp. STSJ-5]MCQ2009770.1 PTS galactitol transporter subunit IIC [Sporolactobacillus sp. STSJ-5]